MNANTLTLQHVRELAHEAGRAAEQSIGWLDGYEPEAIDLCGDAIIYVADCTRPDGSESGIGDTRLRYDSPEYHAAYAAKMRELSAHCAEAATIVDEAERRREIGRLWEVACQHPWVSLDGDRCTDHTGRVWRVWRQENSMWAHELVR